MRNYCSDHSDIIKNVEVLKIKVENIEQSLNKIEINLKEVNADMNSEFNKVSDKFTTIQERQNKTDIAMAELPVKTIVLTATLTAALMNIFTFVVKMLTLK